MATYTDNYNLTKPTFAESADIRTINGNMDTIDDVLHASQVSLADAYDETRTSENPYNTGDIVMYELLMYKCLEDGVYGTWDGTKWERTTAGANGGGSDVEVTPSYNSGTKIAEIDVDGDTEEIYVPEMTGATSQADGTAGLPPAPEAGDEDKFFRGDGTWAEVGGGADYVELTQAEYDALSPAEKMNGKMYFITDASGSGGSGGSSEGDNDDLSDKTWTLITSTTGTSAEIDIPNGTEWLVLTAEMSGRVSEVGKERISNINKLMDVAQLTIWGKGYEWADTIGNHTTISMAVNGDKVSIKSGYNTVTAKVYAVS